MANSNPLGNLKYWFEGETAHVIDNGVVNDSIGVTTDNLLWIGTSEYWCNGTANGYLQGGPGALGDCIQNLIMDVTENTIRGRAYAIIIY